MESVLHKTIVKCLTQNDCLGGDQNARPEKLFLVPWHFQVLNAYCMYC